MARECTVFPISEPRYEEHHVSCLNAFQSGSTGVSSYVVAVGESGELWVVVCCDAKKTLWNPSAQCLARVVASGIEGRYICEHD